jgi:hypothetical protein
MRALRRFFIRLLNVMIMYHSDDRPGDERLREEMESHLMAQTEENISPWHDCTRSSRQARLKFGGTATLSSTINMVILLPTCRKMPRISRPA